MTYWDKLAFEYDPKNPLRKIWSRHDKWIEIFKDALSECKKVLDVGCGAGFPSVFLAKEFELFALDISENMLSIAKKRADELHVDLHFIKADSHLLPFKSCVFDGVYCKFALWPLKNPESAIGEMIRVLKNKGKIVVVEVDRKRKEKSTSLRTKLFYTFYIKLIKQTIFGYPDTRRIWKMIMNDTRENPIVNLSMVKENLKKNNCEILKEYKDLKKITYTKIGRLIGMEHEEYFLCIGEKG